MVKENARYAPFLMGKREWKYSSLGVADTVTGSYACIGRPLALMEMRLVTADVISRFDVEFPVGKDGSEFINHTRDQFVWGVSDLHICFRCTWAKYLYTPFCVLQLVRPISLLLQHTRL